MKRLICALVCSAGLVVTGCGVQDASQTSSDNIASVAQKVAAAQDVLEEPKKYLDCPPL